MFLGADWDGPDCADWPELMTVTQAASLQSPRESLPSERKRIAASDASVWETVFVRQDADYWGLVRALQQAAIEGEIPFELRTQAQSDFSDRVFRAADFVGWLHDQGVRPAPMVEAWHQATVKANPHAARTHRIGRTLADGKGSDSALIHEMRLLRETTEKAAHEADSRHFREVARRAFDRINAATNRSANATRAQPAEVLRPVQRQAAHEAAILGALGQARFDPLRLPVAPAGKPSPPKKAAREALLPSMSASVFNKAWERLRSDGRIADARPSDTLGEGGRLKVGR